MHILQKNWSIQLIIIAEFSIEMHELVITYLRATFIGMFEN